MLIVGRRHRNAAVVQPSSSTGRPAPLAEARGIEPGRVCGVFAKCYGAGVSFDDSGYPEQYPRAMLLPTLARSTIGTCCISLDGSKWSPGSQWWH